MLAVLRHVAAHPGCSRREVELAVAPDRPSTGYNAMQRCAQAGLMSVSLPPITGESRTPPKTAQQILSLTVAR